MAGVGQGGVGELDCPVCFDLPEGVVHQCFEALRPSCQLSPGQAYRSFQLFGFDFMLDAAMKVWLIEVNGAPAAAQRLTTPIAHDLCLHVAQYFGCATHPKTRFKPVLDLMSP